MDVKAKQNRGMSPIPDDPVGLSVVGVRPGSQQGRRYTSSPIPPDPTHLGSQRDISDGVRKPRIKSEALKIARNHQGEAIAQLFNPKFRIIPLCGRPVTADTKDFGKENYVKIKQIQRESRRKQRDQQHQEPVKAVYKPGKFDHVTSKVSADMKSRPASAQRPASANYLRAHSRSGPTVDIIKRPDSAPAPEVRPEKLTVPTSQDCKERNPKPSKPKDHIQKNIKKVPSMKLRRSPSLSALDDLKHKQEDDLKKYKRGAIPQYLCKRREEWVEEEKKRIASMPDPSIPPGHTLMSQKEQKETLATLMKSQAQMLTELRGLPLSKDTVRVKQRRETLENKLKEIELAIKVFSRPKVFIKDD